MRDVRGRKGFVGKIVEDIPVQKNNTSSASFVGDFLYRMFYSTNQLECKVDQVSLKVKTLLNEIRDVYRVSKDTTRVICRAELVARGYRVPDSSSKMPPVARIESPPFHCMSLRRAVFTTLHECIICLKRSSVRLHDKHHEDEDEEKLKEELSVRALNELLRRYRVAVQLFLCDLISSVNEFSQIKKINGKSIDWISSLDENVISPLCYDLGILREMLSRQAHMNKNTKKNLDAVQKKDSKTSPTKVALRHVLLELRSHLDTMSSYVVLCEQSIMEQDKETSLLDHVEKTKCLCEESTQHTVSLWNAARKLAASIDEGNTQMMKGKMDIVSAAADVQQRPSTVDGTWEHETPSGVESIDRDCDDNGDIVITKVYTGETEKMPCDGSDDNGIVLPLALKLNASVLGDLRSKLESRDVSHPKQEIPVEVVSKSSDQDDADRLVLCGGGEGSSIKSSSSLLQSELSSVISRRRRRDIK